MIFSSSNLVKLDLDLDLDTDPDPHSEKLLDPDPNKRNADPQPWCFGSAFFIKWIRIQVRVKLHLSPDLDPGD